MVLCRKLQDLTCCELFRKSPWSWFKLRFFGFDVLHRRPEPVLPVRGVLDDPHDTVRLQDRVLPLHPVPVSHLLVVLRVSGHRISNAVGISVVRFRLRRMLLKRMISHVVWNLSRFVWSSPKILKITREFPRGNGPNRRD